MYTQWYSALAELALEMDDSARFDAAPPEDRTPKRPAAEITIDSYEVRYDDKGNPDHAEFVLYYQHPHRLRGGGMYSTAVVVTKRFSE